MVDATFLAPIVRPGELNRLISVIEDHGGGSGISSSSLVSILNDASYAGQLGIGYAAIELASVLGLASIQDGQVRVSRTGIDFLSLNKEGSYELAPGQVDFLLERSLATIQGKILKSLLLKFESDPKNRTFRVRIPIQSISAAEQWMFDLLRSLGVLSTVGGFAFINSLYVPQASSLRTARKLTKEELEFLLLLQKECGDEAERWVVRYERDRLMNAGFVPEADSVRRISEFDVAAGYDIQSFDGNSDQFVYDRFIEVKSTQCSTPSFVWTANEKRVAAILGEKYWIYVLLQFSPEQAKAELLTIQNPARQIQLGRLKLDALSFRATFVN